MSDSTPRLYTLDDLWDFPDDGHRRELIDGVLYVSPLARLRHQWVVFQLSYLFGGWTKKHGGYVFPGCNVDIERGTHLEPDVVFVRPGRKVRDALSLTEAPDLIVEVSSPSTKRYDLGVKRDRYAQYGTPEFWFADLDRDVILVSVLTEGGGYGETVIYRLGDVVRTRLMPGLEIAVSDVLGPASYGED